MSNYQLSALDFSKPHPLTESKPTKPSKYQAPKLDFTSAHPVQSPLEFANPISNYQGNPAYNAEAMSSAAIAKWKIPAQGDYAASAKSSNGLTFNKLPDKSTHPYIPTTKPGYQSPGKVSIPGSSTPGPTLGIGTSDYTNTPFLHTIHTFASAIATGFKDVIGASKFEFGKLIESNPEYFAKLGTEDTSFGYGGLTIGDRRINSVNKKEVDAMGDYGKSFSESALRYINNAVAQQAEEGITTEDTKSLIYNIGAMVPNFAGTVLVTAITGNPVLGGVYAGIVSNAQGYLSYLRQGISPESASKYAAEKAVVNSVLAMAGGEVAQKLYGTTGAMAETLAQKMLAIGGKVAVQSLIGGTARQLSSNAVDITATHGWGSSVKDFVATDGLRKLTAGLLQATIITAAMSLPFEVVNQWKEDNNFINLYARELKKANGEYTDAELLRMSQIFTNDFMKNSYQYMNTPEGKAAVEQMMKSHSMSEYVTGTKETFDSTGRLVNRSIDVDVEKFLEDYYQYMMRSTRPIDFTKESPPASTWNSETLQLGSGGAQSAAEISTNPVNIGGGPEIVQPLVAQIATPAPIPVSQNALSAPQTTSSVEMVPVNGVEFKVSNGDLGVATEYAAELARTPAKFSLTILKPQDLIKPGVQIIYSPKELAGAYVRPAGEDYYNGSGIPANAAEVGGVFRHDKTDGTKSTKGMGENAVNTAILTAIRYHPDAPMIVLDCFKGHGLDKYYEEHFGFYVVHTVPYNSDYATDDMRRAFPNGDGPDIAVMVLDLEKWKQKYPALAAKLNTTGTKSFADNPPEPETNPATGMVRKLVMDSEGNLRYADVNEVYNGQNPDATTATTDSGFHAQHSLHRSAKESSGVTTVAVSGGAIYTRAINTVVEGKPVTVRFSYFKETGKEVGIDFDSEARKILSDLESGDPERISATGLLLDTAHGSGAYFSDLLVPGVEATASSAVMVKLRDGKTVMLVLSQLTGTSGPKISGPDKRWLFTSMRENGIYLEIVRQLQPLIYKSSKDFVNKWNADNPGADTPMSILDPHSLSNEERVKLNEIAYAISDKHNLDRLGKIYTLYFVRAVIPKNSIAPPSGFENVFAAYDKVMVGVSVSFKNPEDMPYLLDVLHDIQIFNMKPGDLKPKAVGGFYQRKTALIKPYALPAKGMRILTGIVKTALNASMGKMTPEVEKQVTGTPGSKPTVASLPPFGKKSAQNIRDAYNNILRRSGREPIWNDKTNTWEDDPGLTISPDFQIATEPTEDGFHAEESAENDIVQNSDSTLKNNLVEMGAGVNPARLVKQVLDHDPLQWFSKRTGAYRLIYDDNTLKDLATGYGNPSLANSKLLGNWIRTKTVWFPLVGGQTRASIASIHNNANIQRSDIIKLSSEFAKLSDDDLIDVLYKIKGGSVPAINGAVGAIRHNQDLANRFIQASEKIRNDFINQCGIDPQVFARLQGHYLPSPHDDLNKTLLPDMDVTQTIRPSLRHLMRQNMSPDDIIGMATRDPQAYREYMFNTLLGEVRGAEKGGVINAVALDPNSNVVDANLAPEKGYVRVAGGLNAFMLSEKAIPTWLADELNNEFISSDVSRSIKAQMEIISWFKYFKTGLNPRVLLRNAISQFTLQSLESGITPLDYQNYFIRPLGAVLGLNKADQEEAIGVGLMDTSLAEEFKDFGLTQVESDLWRDKKGVSLVLARIYAILAKTKTKSSALYGSIDAITKIGSYFANKEQYGPAAAANLAAIATGNYTQRPIFTNLLSKGIWNGKPTTWSLLLNNNFAFYKTVVEPARVGNLLYYHPTVLIGYIAMAGLTFEAAINTISKRYKISKERATELMGEFQNYVNLDGKIVIPLDDGTGIDITDLIPMAKTLANIRQVIDTSPTLFKDISIAVNTLAGTDTSNVVLNILLSWQTGYDQGVLQSFGYTKSIGKNTLEQALWTAKQFLPSWIGKAIHHDATLADFIGATIITVDQNKKIQLFRNLTSDGTIPAEKKLEIARKLGIIN